MDASCEQNHILPMDLSHHKFSPMTNVCRDREVGYLSILHDLWVFYFISNAFMSTAEDYPCIYF